MRLVGLLLTLCWFVPSAHAACPADGVQLFPAPGSVVPTNTRLLLEGVGSLSEKVGALPGRVLRMQTEGHEVEVRVQRGWTSTLGRTLVILRLSGPLKPGLVYTLRLDDVLPGVKVLNSMMGHSRPEWNSGRGQDLARPRWLKRPVVSEGIFRRTREGSERFVKLRMSLSEDSPAYAQVTLSRSKDKDNMAPQHYVLPLHDGVALLGHGACGGAFALEDGKSYRAKIDVFDAAGNLVPGVAPLQFESPVATQENP
ncbi:hypothetical protein D187_001025 [Cystobacter fuscus DSM 2262]|uniref:Lipoprotein n=1 Tax=Cystobacter fuscus (strain ATCC 25194 / DSM 2262 / NBRC 100088 / M29) TaxID=1242864 RepID=S9PFS0_CYSF2|nr:hypothetical protein [Cystobacter fuscus]EPX61242.1 hypothetical protein D187_001025 [Cystobacter fuscus DSM 2262]